MSVRNTCLAASQVPFINCPCCVPELYEVGGDIDCDFTNPALPIPEPDPTPSPTKVPLLLLLVLLLFAVAGVGVFFLIVEQVSVGLYISPENGPQPKERLNLFACHGYVVDRT